MPTKPKHKTIYHVQVNHGKGWRLWYQVYSKKSADNLLAKRKEEIAKWKSPHPQLRVVKVQRRTKGLVQLSRSGRVLGYAD